MLVTSPCARSDWTGRKNFKHAPRCAKHRPAKSSRTRQCLGFTLRPEDIASGWARTHPLFCPSHTSFPMLKAKSIGVIVITVVVCIGLWQPLKKSFIMSKSEAQGASGDSGQPEPQVHIEVVGFDKAAEAGIPKVQLVAYVENPSDDHIKILRWNSVLDPQAGVLGAVSLRQQQSAAAVDTPTIKINRKMPPPDDDYIHIGPHARVSNSITLALTTTKLEEGVGYEALAQGRFMEVYRGDGQGDPTSTPYSCEPVGFTA